MIIEPSALGRLRRLALGISPEETTFARRGFPGSFAPDARERLERVGRAFVKGYHAALLAGAPEALDREFGDVRPDLRGFAVEGASMAFTLLDRLTPWERGRVERLLAGWGEDHTYMIHVGAGWALARLRRQLDGALARMDPLLGWLVVDGYGFHEGYFRWKRWVADQEVPERLSGYARRAFDQGLGRSLWFVRGASGDLVAATVKAFPPHRRADLWSGVGLACAYAGGAPRDVIEALRAAAGDLAPHLAQGAAFAAKARERAGIPTEYTEMACAVLCKGKGKGKGTARAAAAVTDDALEGLPGDGAEPAYEAWRGRIRAVFAREAVS